MRSSYIWAAVLTIAIGGWLASGQVIIGGQGDSDPVDGPSAGDSAATGGSLSVGAEDADSADTPFRVRVRTISSMDRIAEYKVRGRTEADQRVNLRAQTSGLVEEIPVRKGDLVKTGDLVCQLETGSREAHVLRARAAVAQAELEHDGATTLSEKGYAAQTRVRAMKAGLDAARATLKEMELDLARTQVKAPFDGVVNAIPADIGSMLGIGDPCAEIVASDPMLVVAQVSEREIGRLRTGMHGTARLVTGDTAEGTLRYIAPSSDQATRTFRIELAIPNTDWRLRDGVTAEISIPLETTKAHRFTPAILTLDDKGVIGVRTIEDGNRVGFRPVRILGNEDGSIWVAGLPETVTIITVGQEYVSVGEIVEPVFETAANTRTGDEAGGTAQ